MESGGYVQKLFWNWKVSNIPYLVNAVFLESNLKNIKTPARLEPTVYRSADDT